MRRDKGALRGETRGEGGGGGRVDSEEEREGGALAEKGRRGEAD